MSQSLYTLENVMREAQKTLNSVNEALPPGDPSYPLFTSIAELAPPAQLTLDACVYRRGHSNTSRRPRRHSIVASSANGSGSGRCHGHHMATMATPKLNLEKNKEGCEGVITTQLILPRRFLLEVGRGGGHGGHGGQEPKVTQGAVLRGRGDAVWPTRPARMARTTPSHA